MRDGRLASSAHVAGTQEQERERNCKERTSGCKLGMIQIAVIFLVFFSQYASGDEDVSVKTTKGQVTGKRITVGINDSTGLYHGTADVFLGIPFAESTAPPMRFQLPLERKPWSQTLLATDWPAACPQDPAQISPKFNVSMSEDCLSVNVFTPNANSDKKLPVMIWIHGGAFVFGYAKKFPADGIITNLVNRGVVVVTIQYRLGALGFFTTRTHDFEANLGLFDQLMAFRWVQREISNFGGDAGNVTIFGESAGACSVAFHTYSNISVTQNLYHRAIIESGAAKTCLSGYLYRDQQQSHDFALKLCAKYNFTTAQWNSGNFNNLNTCLNTESYASIVEAKAGVWLVVAHPNSTFLPGMPKQLAEAMGKNRPPLPVIIGTNRDEMVADVGNNTSQGQTPLKDFTSDAVIAQAKIIAANYPNNNDKIADILGRVYKSPYINSTDNIGWLKAITQMNTARNFFGPTLEDAKIWLGTNGNPNVRMYSLEYGASALSDYYAATPGYTPVAHTFDLAYIFILPDFWIPFLKNISASDRSMIDQFGQMWTNFAKYGDPTPSSSNLPRWDPISLQHQDSYYIINNPSMMASPYFWKDTLLYNDVIPTLAQI